MLLFDYVLVGKHERLLVIRKGRFEQILEPGEHIVFGHGVRFEKHDVRDVIFDSVWAEPIAREHPALASRYFVAVEPVGRTAVVSVAGKAARVVRPGKRILYWKGAGPVSVTFRDAKLRARSAVVGAV